MSPAVRDLMSAAAAVLRNCRPRHTRDEESYLDELASALTEVEREAGEAPKPVARSYMSAERALVMQRVVDAARELVDLHDEEGEPHDGSLEARLDLACTVNELADVINALDVLDAQAEFVATLDATFVTESQKLTADEPKPYCRACDLDLHACPGCGANASHEAPVCDACNADFVKVEAGR